MPRAQFRSLNVQYVHTHSTQDGTALARVQSLLLARVLQRLLLVVQCVPAHLYRMGRNQFHHLRTEIRPAE